MSLKNVYYDTGVMISKWMLQLKHLSFADWPITNTFFLLVFL